MESRTPRAVPIVVSAGLAIGVFCGLLFGLGTGASEAATEQRPKPTPAVETAAVINPPPQVAPPAPAAKPVPPAPVAPVAPVAVAPRTAKLTVDISPAAAASGAKISIDGEPIDGTSIELPVEQKSVRLSINSAGFRQVTKKIDLEGVDTIIRQEMSRRIASGGTGKSRPSSAPTNSAPPPRPPSNGVIDL